MSRLGMPAVTAALLLLLLGLLRGCQGIFEEEDFFRRPFPRWPPWRPPTNLCSNYHPPCSSNRDCYRSCGSRKVECVGCPKCPDLKLDGSCHPEGTIAVRCAAPVCGPTCEKGQKCKRDSDCGTGCNLQCKKCPPNGCPGRDVGTCMPPNEQIFCTLEICHPQDEVPLVDTP